MQDIHCYNLYYDEGTMCANNHVKLILIQYVCDARLKKIDIAVWTVYC